MGNYTLGRLIGKGSFGKVYLATHKLTNGSKVRGRCPPPQKLFFPWKPADPLAPAGRAQVCRQGRPEPRARDTPPPPVRPPTHRPPVRGHRDRVAGMAGAGILLGCVHPSLSPTWPPYATPTDTGPQATSSTTTSSSTGPSPSPRSSASSRSSSAPSPTSTCSPASTAT